MSPANQTDMVSPTADTGRRFIRGRQFLSLLPLELFQLPYLGRRENNGHKHNKYYLKSKEKVSFKETKQIIGWVWIFQDGPESDPLLCPFSLTDTSQDRSSHLLEIFAHLYIVCKTCYNIKIPTEKKQVNLIGLIKIRTRCSFNKYYWLSHESCWFIYTISDCPYYTVMWLVIYKYCYL